LKNYAIHWFRRDLRLAGNPALEWAREEFDGRVVGIFCFDKKFLARSDFSANRFAFFIETLKSLKQELADAGGDLLFLDEGPDQAFSALVDKLKAASIPLPQCFTFNRDYEPYAVARDQRIEALLKKSGIGSHTERDHLLVEPHEIIKESDPSKPFQVFTPFSKTWLKAFVSGDVQDRVQFQRRGLTYLSARDRGNAKSLFSLTWKGLFGKAVPFTDSLESYERENRKRVTVDIPPAGSGAAYARCRQFKSKIDEYANARDVPGVEGTSRFSIYFKNGSLTVPQVIAALDLKAYGKRAETGPAKFLNELIWREFYYYILAKFPNVERESFNPKYRKLKWGDNEKYFRAWTEGKTGYPIVDAGMRELNTTGWMHNRVRMIVASFLTKDLLVNWQWGERYFMEKLLDGDLAPNNGGWQWSASTGCDPQPYFRIFNPYLQSKKFDPEGAYIRRFVPELAHLSARDIHEPPAHSRNGYPAPIVDHSEQRDKALELFRTYSE